MSSHDPLHKPQKDRTGPNQKTCFSAMKPAKKHACDILGKETISAVIMLNVSIYSRGSTLLLSPPRQSRPRRIPLSIRAVLELGRGAQKYMCELRVVRLHGHFGLQLPQLLFFVVFFLRMPSWSSPSDYHFHEKGQLCPLF